MPDSMFKRKKNGEQDSANDNDQEDDASMYRAVTVYNSDESEKPKQYGSTNCEHNLDTGTGRANHDTDN